MKNFLYIALFSLSIPHVSICAPGESKKNITKQRETISPALCLLRAQQTLRSPELRFLAKGRSWAQSAIRDIETIKAGTKLDRKIQRLEKKEQRFQKRCYQRKRKLSQRKQGEKNETADNLPGEIIATSVLHNLQCERSLHALAQKAGDQEKLVDILN